MSLYLKNEIKQKYPSILKNIKQFDEDLNDPSIKLDKQYEELNFEDEDYKGFLEKLKNLCENLSDYELTEIQDDRELSYVKCFIRLYVESQRFIFIVDKEFNKSIDQIDYKNENTELNYNLIEEYKGLFYKSKLAGVYHWVFHSDCDDFLSSGECHDIIESLKKISPFMKGILDDEEELFIKNEDDDDDEEYKEEEKYKRYYLYPVFIYSLEMDEVVEFC
jgi:hypothetical protein